MQIARIGCIPVEVPFRKTWSISGGDSRVNRNVLVMIVDGSGRYGIGEATPDPAYSDETQATVIDVIRELLGPALMGQDPRQLDKMDALMERAVRGHPFAKGALSIALYDLVGKALDVPVHQLLGGKRVDRVPFIATVGIGTCEDMVADALALVRSGYNEMKMKIGRSLQDDLVRLEAIRDAVGPNVRIRVDANQGYRSGDALPALRRMERFDLVWIEQPVPRWDLDGMARLCAGLNTNVLADESVYSPSDVLTLARHEATDAVNLKTNKYGLGNARKILAVADAAGLPCMVGSMMQMGISLAASLHVCCTHDFSYAAELDGPLLTADDIVVGNPYSSAPAEKFWPVPEGVGLGVELKPEYLQALEAELNRP